MPPPPETDPAPDPRRRRLLFRASHRGTQENDLMIGSFVAIRIASLTAAEIDSLEILLELPDADLGDWLTGRRSVPPGAGFELVREMRDHVMAGGAVQRP